MSRHPPTHTYGGGLSDGRVLPPMPNVPSSMPSMGEHQTMSPHLSHPYGGGLSDGRVLPPMPNVPASMPSMGEHQFMNPHSTHKKAYSLPYRPHPQPGAAAQPPGMGRLYGGSPVSLIGSDKSSFSSSRLRSNEDGYSIGGNDNIHLPTIVGPSPKQGNGPHIQSMNTKGARLFSHLLLVRIPSRSICARWDASAIDEQCACRGGGAACCGGCGAVASP